MKTRGASSGVPYKIKTDIPKPWKPCHAAVTVHKLRNRMGLHKYLLSVDGFPVRRRLMTATGITKKNKKKKGSRLWPGMVMEMARYYNDEKGYGKYYLTDETRVMEDGTVVYRIASNSEWENQFGEVIQAGEKGGFVESFDNLMQFDDSWIYNDAVVYGGACVGCAASVCDNAIVRGNACVCDDACVFGDAIVEDDAFICRNAQIYDTVISGDAYITR